MDATENSNGTGFSTVFCTPKRTPRKGMVMVNENKEKITERRL